jgi:hypothetical protein
MFRIRLSATAVSFLIDLFDKALHIAWELSIALLVMVLLYQCLRVWLGRAYALVIAVLWLFELLSSDVVKPIETKGLNENAPWVMIGLMYVSMILGIVAQSFYLSESTSPSANWINPSLASPIIFIPLLSSYQSSLANMEPVQPSPIS